MARIGVDIGGTFTDLICSDEVTGRVWVSKAPSTPSQLESGVIDALAAVPSEVVKRADIFVHGTTVGLNALLQRTGAATGLLCTAGFRDVLEIRRADRGEMYNVHWKQPAAFVRRRHRVPVRGRIRADGHVLQPLSEDDVAHAVDVFRTAGIEAIAVCFINSYVNPEHELLAEELLRAGGWTGDISLSHRLSREYREYERTSTTVIDAYVRGLTSRYLDRLGTALGRAQFSGEILITRSGGGLMSARDVEQRPFEAIQSGPVAGVEGAADLCRQRGVELAIAADVGGTSFDASLIIRGRPHVNYEGELLGWPVQTPWVDVQSIGAGGGSIAYADHDLLRVGPMSAGAQPGPASYGQGGDKPTVTDAALLLGMLGPGVLSNGIQLDAAAAGSAIESLAQSLNLSRDGAAQGVIRVVTASMAEVLRERTIGQGEDPRRAALIAFGGAGPLFATLLALELGVDDVLIPEHAGNFSAFGLLGQDITHEESRTHIRILSADTVEEISSALAAMFAQIDYRHPHIGSGRIECRAGLDIRYVGQDHAIRVTCDFVPGRGLPGEAEISRVFEEQYLRRFSVSLDEALEVVALRATRRLVREGLNRAPSTVQHAVVGADSIWAYSFGRETWTDFRLLQRSALEPDQPEFGPIIVLEPTATTYVDTDFSVTRAEDGVLELTRSTKIE